jgi:hypothetical protein
MTMGTIVYNEQPGTSDAALYTAGSGGVIIPNVVAINATDSAVTLNLNVHRTISGAVETICSGLSIPAGTAQQITNPTYLAAAGIELLDGDSLHGSAGTGSALTLVAFE